MKFELNLDDYETDLLFTALEEKSGDWDVDEGENEFEMLIEKIKKAMKI